MPREFVQKNGVIKAVTLIRHKPVAMWLTVWPFAVIYLIQLVVYTDPELVWGKITYLVWQKYIDFFHVTTWPVLFFIHAFVALLTVWSVKVKKAFLYTECEVESATHVLIETQPHKGESQVIPLLRGATCPSSPARVRGTAAPEIFFVFQQRKWKYDAAEKKIFTKPHFPTKLTFREYGKLQGLTNTEIVASRDAFGENRVIIHIPNFMELFVDHAFAPFFDFQMFCVLLWCLDEYWMYSIFTGFMMVMLECTVVFQRINNMKSLRAMGDIPVTNVDVIRDGRRMTVKSSELVPLDVIQIPMNRPAPADILIVAGGCVVNEAMLTGESTPQMKEAIDAASDAPLQMKKHMRHIVFSGTEILTSTPAAHSGKAEATGIVLKTGFETKQGKLLRTIIHSQSRVSQNSGEAFAFILFLLCFALMAVGYLLKRGLADPNRSRWKLVLHTTQIITAVVPPELPMELSLAVNSSLMQLVKLKVFCTEPFRIPFAGKVDTCCFDKTGTLTTDEMLFSGVDACDGKGVRAKLQELEPAVEAALCGCHSLVQLEGELAGDAMEKAAVVALGFKCVREDTFQSTDNKRTLTILTRFQFDPDLRRMSCVVNADWNAVSTKMVVVKGSPESIKSLCEPSTIPDDFEAIVDSYTSKGLRVIALATKRLTGGKSEVANMTREAAERGLDFEGLAIFQCPLKRDTIETIANLMHGSHRCCIITGDNIHTAVAVGKDVGMVIGKRQLLATPAATTPGGIAWEDVTSFSASISADGKSAAAPTHHRAASELLTLTPKELKGKVISPELLKRIGTRTPNPAERIRKCREAIEYDLCVNAEVFTSAQFATLVQQFGDMVTVWARCAPAQKEDIVSHLKACGRVVLMAGDGTNDVGGLKQAHVGVAVLNSAAVAASEKAAKENPGAVAGIGPNGLPPLPAEPGPSAGIMERAKYEMAKARHAAIEANRRRLEAANDPEKFVVTPMPTDPGPRAGFMERARFEAVRQQHLRETEMKKKLIEAKAAGKSGASALVAASPTGLPETDFFNSSVFNTDEMEDGRSAPITKLGDASIAAPFTCKSRKMMALCDLVRLGRSTLVTTLQMYKILALNCLISAYSMSVLHSDGVKLGDYQMVVTGLVISVCFLCVNFSKPLPTLSPQRPITRVFHPYMITSILGQFGVHLYSIISSVNLVANIDPENIAEQRQNVDHAEFKPTLLNTIVFLMTTLMTAVTFAVNYKGEPFMQPMRQNKMLFFALIGLTSLIFYLAAEIDPDTNQLLEVVKFPSDEFRSEFLKLLVFDAAGAFIVEKACLYLLTD